MRKNTNPVLLFVISAILMMLVFILFQTQFFRFYPSTNLSTENHKELTVLGTHAIESLDVPVAALVLIEDSIIGRGYNTVYRDGNIAGHAEINAINNAIESIGIDAFMEMDKSKVTMVSSFEPCEMCKGMLVHYRINNVFFLKDKSYSRWLKNHMAGLKYELSKRQTGREKLQDSLFLLHPDYPGK